MSHEQVVPELMWHCLVAVSTVVVAVVILAGVHCVHVCPQTLRVRAKIRDPARGRQYRDYVMEGYQVQPKPGPSLDSLV